MRITTEVHQRHSDALVIIYDQDNDQPHMPIGSVVVEKESVELWQKGLEAINQLAATTG